MEVDGFTRAALAAIAIAGSAPAFASTPLVTGTAAEAPLPDFIALSAVSAFASNSSPAPHLTEINYERLYRRLIQAGMFSQVLGYTLSVDAEGRVTGCSFTRDFRMEVTKRDLCRAFARSFSFQPARDAAGNPVTGQYHGRIEVASFFQPNL